MYIPFGLTFWYFYLSVKKLPNNSRGPNTLEFINVLRNVLITEILFLVTDWYIFPSIFIESFSLLNIIGFFIIQDIYFYSIHKLLHILLFNSVHSLHHKHYAPYNAWYASLPDHLLLNVGSLGVPFYLFPNTRWLFMIIVFLEIYTSINGHTMNSPHHKHHLDYTKRLGSLYIIDRLMGSF